MKKVSIRATNFQVDNQKRNWNLLTGGRCPAPQLLQPGNMWQDMAKFAASAYFASLPPPCPLCGQLSLPGDSTGDTGDPNFYSDPTRCPKSTQIRILFPFWTKILVCYLLLSQKYSSKIFWRQFLYVIFRLPCRSAYIV